MSAEPPETRSLLIVEDDEVLRSRLSRAFRERGFEVLEAADAESAEARARAESPELALVDLRLPGPSVSGLDLVRSLLEIDRATTVVVLTGYGSIATALEAIRLGAAHYLTKPADVEEILAGFARAVGPPPEATPIENAPTLARVEWEHINRVLSDCGGNISKAARVLGIHRRSLQRKLSKFPSSR